MKTVNIYTDGACRGNPGPGGWGVLIEHGDVKKELFGGIPRAPAPRRHREGSARFQEL